MYKWRVVYHPERDEIRIAHFTNSENSVKLFRNILIVSSKSDRYFIRQGYLSDKWIIIGDYE